MDGLNLTTPDPAVNAFSGPPTSQLDHEFVVTEFVDLVARAKREETRSLRSLAQHIRGTEALAKKHLPLLKLARFGELRTGNGCLRHNDNVLVCTGLEVDYDGEKVTVDDAVSTLSSNRLLALVYTSPSHAAEKPRWRMLLPFSTEHPPGYRDKMMKWLNGLFNGIFSIESWTLSQSYYFGFVNGGPDQRCEMVSGTPLDLHAELDTGQLAKSSSSSDGHSIKHQASTFERNQSLLSGQMASTFVGRIIPDLNAATQVGVNADFAAMSSDQKNLMLAAMLALPEIRRFADVERLDGWLNILFALADAERLGGTEARVLALAWSKTSVRFNEQDFDRDWRSFRPKCNGVTVGTLLRKAKDAGFDIGFWLARTTLCTTSRRPTEDVLVARPIPSWDSVPAVMDPVTAITVFNQLLGFARSFDGRPSYFMRQPHGGVQAISLEELSSLMAPHLVRVETGTDAKLISAKTWWSASHGRYAVDSVEYDPENERAKVGVRIENTWRGFAIKEAKGSWRRLRWHLLHVVCGGNKLYFKYLLRWLAHSVQRPGTAPEVMVILRSTSEGVGKSTVGQFMLRIFGRHGHEATSLNEIFGEFNEVIIAKSFILLEENAFPGDHKLATALKGMLTAACLSINPKGRKRFQVPNVLHMLQTTNDEWAVPAGADARRYFVLDISRKENAKYFEKLYAEAETGGVAAMLYDLLRVSLSRFSPRDVPVTGALIQQQRMSADDITGWIMDAVVTQSLVASSQSGLTSNGGFGQSLSHAALFGSYLDWTRQQGFRHPKSAIAFGRALRKLGFARGAGHSPAMWTVPDAMTVLKAAERRAGIRQLTR